MRKIGRNDLCSCGSGIKHKKCCGSSIVRTKKTNPQTINQDLFKLHQQLVSFISTKYMDEVEEQVNFHSKSKSLDEDSIEIYKTGLIPWIILHDSLSNSEDTIFTKFTKNTIIPAHSKEYFTKWADAIPSVYGVVAIGKPNKEFVTIRDILTKQTFHIPYHPDNELIKGSLLIGTLIPFAHYHNFLYTMIKLYNRDADVYVDMLNQYNNTDGGMIESFPNFLLQALATGMDQSEWDDVSYEDVAQLFVDHMIEKNIDDQVISKGVLLWQQYSSDEKPVIKKAETYAAGLDYFMQREFANTETTQKDLADEYDVSPGTVSKIYRNLKIYSDSKL